MAPSLWYCPYHFSSNVSNSVLWSALLSRFRIFSTPLLFLDGLLFLRLRLIIYLGKRLICYYFISLTVSSASLATLRQINDNETWTWSKHFPQNPRSKTSRKSIPCPMWTDGQTEVMELIFALCSFLRTRLETEYWNQSYALTLRLLMSYIYIYIYIYIYGVPILDVSRSHTTTQHSR